MTQLLVQARFARVVDEDLEIDGEEKAEFLPPGTLLRGVHATDAAPDADTEYTAQALIGVRWVGVTWYGQEGSVEHRTGQFSSLLVEVPETGGVEKAITEVPK